MHLQLRHTVLPLAAAYCTTVMSATLVPVGVTVSAAYGATTQGTAAVQQLASTSTSAEPNAKLTSLAPNTAIALTAYNSPYLAGCTASPSTITDYSRFTYDPVNHQVLMFGGGHSATPRTDVDVFDLTKFIWSSAYASTPVYEMTVANFNSQVGSWRSTGHPLARHTLDLLQFARNTGELILLTEVSTQPRCMELYNWERYPGKIWHYHPVTRQWTPSPAAPLWTGWPASEYDPVSGKMVVVGRYGLYTYDPVTKVATQHQRFARGELSYNQNLVYYPPTDTMYYVLGNGTVFELKLNRSDLAKSTITEVLGITGNRPTGRETGWAYDSANRIIGGGVTNGVFYAFDPATKTWTSRTMQVSGSGTIGTVAFHALDYDPVNNVFLFQGQVNRAQTTWAYRFGGTANPSVTPTPSPTPTTSPTPTSPSTTTPSPTPTSTAPLEDFNTRCSASGVVRCITFDTDADIAGRYRANTGITVGTHTQPTIDPTVRASGTGSLKFTIPPNSGANSSGSYFANFSNDLSVQFGENSEFFVQWRQRFSPEFINTFFEGNSGIKQAILGPGDTPTKIWNSCEAIHLVLTSYYQERFTTAYNSCTGSGSHAAYSGLYERYGTSNWKLQNAMPEPYCTYRDARATTSPAFPGTCFGWYANEWMTFQVGITLGPRDNATNDFSNSRVRVWVARQGQPSQLIIDWKPGIPGYFPLAAGPLAENQRFGKIWLLPYQTTKVATQAHPTAYTWYDELIVSRTRIADPK